MGFFSKLLGKKETEAKVGGMEDFMTLIRVYFEASLAANLGINNLGMLPDLRTFKATLHVPTLNNKLGLGEKEIDQSIRKNCRKLQDVQPYMIQFQGFSQDLMMLVGNLMKFKLRLPSFMKKALYTMTEKTVSDLFTKNDYSDPGVIKAVMAVRQYDKRLGFSLKWITDFVFQVVMLAKKEPRPSDTDVKKK